MNKLDDSKMPSQEEEAQNLLEQAKQKRMQECSAEVATVLQKYGCTIVPQIILHGSRVIPRFFIVPVSPNTPPAKILTNDNGQ